MESESIQALLQTLGMNLSPDQIAARQRRHTAGVRAAKERFEQWDTWQLTSRRNERAPFNVYQNREYIAAVAEVDTQHSYFGVVTYLVCARRDGEPVHSWLDLQRIKSTLVGEELVAIEVYPPDSHLLDTANCYHLWVLPGHRRDFPLDLTVLNQKRSRASQNQSFKSQRQRQRDVNARARNR
jgi:hypothetical protein